jgi:site-specific DNA recombinase
LKEAARKAHAAGLVYPRSGAKVPVSTVHTILRNRLYTGCFEWNGKLIQGKHEALVPVDLWEHVQGVLDGRFAKKAKRGRHGFAFSGLIACERCGCAVVGEIKKERYVYYHCTGYADKCQGNPATCRCKHVREDALEAQFTELLGRLRFDDEVPELGARGASRQPCRRATRARGGDSAPSDRIQAARRAHSRHVH